MFSRFEFDIFGIYKNIHHVSRFACHIWVIKWVFFMVFNYIISEKYQNYIRWVLGNFFLFSHFNKNIALQFHFETKRVTFMLPLAMRFVHDNKFIFIFLLADNQTKQKMHLHLAQALLGKEIYPAQRVYQVYWNLIHQPTAFNSIQPKSHSNSTQQTKMISQTQ